MFHVCLGLVKYFLVVCFFFPHVKCLSSSQEREEERKKTQATGGVGVGGGGMEYSLVLQGLSTPVEMRGKPAGDKAQTRPSAVLTSGHLICRAEV